MDTTIAPARAFDISAEALIDKAAALRPLLAGNAAEAERNRRLPAENIDALDALNLTALTLPARFGGLAASLTTACRVLEELGKGCTSTAWVSMIQFHATHTIVNAPAAIREDIFATPVKRVSAVGTHPGKATAQRAEGGFTISGQWDFTTGSMHADWVVLLNIPILDKGDLTGFVDAYLPVAEAQILETWDVAGMSGTGSNTVVADGLFIAEERVRHNELATFVDNSAPSSGESPSDDMAFVPVLSLSQLAVAVGTAEAMAELVVERAPRRPITYTVFGHQTESQVAVHDIAEALLQIRTARLLLLDATREVDELAVSGVQMPFLDRARIRGTVGYAMVLLRTAADTLMSQGGASSFASSDPLQRQWRDLNLLSRHALTGSGTSVEAYGRAVFGIEPAVSPMI